MRLSLLVSSAFIWWTFLKQMLASRSLLWQMRKLQSLQSHCIKAAHRKVCTQVLQVVRCFYGIIYWKRSLLLRVCEPRKSSLHRAMMVEKQNESAHNFGMLFDCWRTKNLTHRARYIGKVLNNFCLFDVTERARRTSYISTVLDVYTVCNV